MNINVIPDVVSYFSQVYSAIWKGLDSSQIDAAKLFETYIGTAHKK